MPLSYSRPQIILHWLIFVLIAVQFLLHEPMSEAWDRIEDGLEVAFHPLVVAHVFGGLVIGGLVLWRVFLRVTRGAPDLPAEEPAVLKLAASATHLGLYALMILMPVSGILAWFGGIYAAAEVHEVMKVLLLLLVALHLGGVLYQQFILKTNVMARMKPTK